MPANKHKKNCPKHGEVTHYRKKDNSFTCAKCYVAILDEFRINRRLELIGMLGGACSRCGFDNPAAIDFHHQRDKLFNITLRSMTKNFKSLLLEIKKCILLCANYHRIEHTKKYGRMG